MRAATTTKAGSRATAALLLGALMVALTACGFGPFDDLERRVPIARVERGGGLKSDFFGGLLLGGQVQPPDEGAALLALGTGSHPGLLVARFGADGKHRTSASSGSQYSTALDLGNNQPRSLSPVLGGPASLAGGEGLGPFAYVGATGVGSSSSEAGGVVVLANFGTFQAVAALRPSDLAPAADSQALDFGAGIVPFALVRNASGDPTSRGLLIGGRSRLWGYLDDDWNKKPTRHVISGSGVAKWPALTGSDSNFVTLAAGNLDGSSDGADEVVLAAPGANFVALLRPSAGLENCADGGSGCPLVAIDTPDAARDFGRALLIANVDADPQPELLVGAPLGGGGAVFVFDVAGSGTATLRATIPAPDGAEGFGHALAIGRFEGTERVLLAIGAPLTRNESAASAGRIYLYQPGELLAESAPGAPVASAALRDAKAGQLLGQTLTTLPFRRGAVYADLLATNGTDAALVFFANLTDQQLDLRVR